MSNIFRVSLELRGLCLYVFWKWLNLKQLEANLPLFGVRITGKPLASSWLGLVGRLQKGQSLWEREHAHMHTQGPVNPPFMLLQWPWSRPLLGLERPQGWVGGWLFHLRQTRIFRSSRRQQENQERKEWGGGRGALWWIFNKCCKWGSLSYSPKLEKSPTEQGCPKEACVAVRSHRDQLHPGTGCFWKSFLLCFARVCPCSWKWGRSSIC